MSIKKWRSPIFEKKNVLAQILAQIRPEMRFLAYISRKDHYLLLKTSAIVENDEKNHCWKFQVQKKMVLKISSLLEFGHARAALGKLDFLQFGTC